MDTNKQRFIEFREELYKNLNSRADATMDLIDALCGNQTAASPVLLSLNSLFRRWYASLHDAVDNFYISKTAKHERAEQQLKFMRVTSSLIPVPCSRNYYLFAADATSQPRQSAETFRDRGFVYRLTRSKVINRLQSVIAIQFWRECRKKRVRQFLHG